MSKVRLKNIKARHFSCQLTSHPLPAATMRFGAVERDVPSYESFDLRPHEEKVIEAALLDEPAISGAINEKWLRNLGAVVEVTEAVEADALDEAVEDEADQEDIEPSADSE